MGRPSHSFVLINYSSQPGLLARPAILKALLRVGVPALLTCE